MCPVCSFLALASNESSHRPSSPELFAPTEGAGASIGTSSSSFKPTRYHPNKLSCGSMLEVTCGRTCEVEGGWSHSKKPWEECWNGLMKIKACGCTILYHYRGSTWSLIFPQGVIEHSTTIEVVAPACTRLAVPTTISDQPRPPLCCPGLHLWLRRLCHI